MHIYNGIASANKISTNFFVSRCSLLDNVLVSYFWFHFTFSTLFLGRTGSCGVEELCKQQRQHDPDPVNSLKFISNVSSNCWCSHRFFQQTRDKNFSLGSVNGRVKSVANKISSSRVKSAVHNLGFLFFFIHTHASFYVITFTDMPISRNPLTILHFEWVSEWHLHQYTQTETEVEAEAHAIHFNTQTHAHVWNKQQRKCFLAVWVHILFGINEFKMSCLHA